MLKHYKSIFFLLLFSAYSYAQVESVPAEHPVYPFLKRLQAMGVIHNYNDVILPLRREEVNSFLTEADTSSIRPGAADLEYLARMKEEFLKPGSSITDDFSILFSEQQKHLYQYKDSAIAFYADPVLDLSYIYSDDEDGSSTLFNFGGRLYGSYDGWLGFYLQGTNGIQGGNRLVALTDPRVEQSYTFNTTGMNYFDGTSGYLRFKKGIVSLQAGRERILWGAGYINKLLLSDNPPLFDFLKFDISYKSLSYSFIHGWLVQKPVVFTVDSLMGDFKQKNPKYFAISRLGFRPGEWLSIGVSQVIVYSNRPFEAAYLNPFLFWESAQRSMNDLDNSMLCFDARSLLTNGLELSASFLFDDLDFSKASEGTWIDNTNGSAWQAGAYITSPILPDGFSFRLEYMQLRPYVFSHHGIEEALTFTNNGYMLGTDIQPNSVLISAALDYRFSGKVNAVVKYNQYLHGNNIYDGDGNIIRNVGGSVFNSLTWNDSLTPYLLDGIRERTDEFILSLDYEFVYGFFLNFRYIHRIENIAGNKLSENIFWGVFKFQL